MARKLKNLQIHEISSVDRGAGEGVQVMLMKRDFSSDERQEMAGSGEAMPGGGFPIANVGDLENAIRAIGRAKDPAAARRHIISRARALGATSKLPDGWAVGKALDALDVAIKSVLADENLSRGDIAKAVTESLEQFDDCIQKDDVTMADGKKPAPAAHDEPDADDKVVDREEELKGCKKRIDALESELAVTKLSAVHKAHYDALPEADRAAFLKADTAERDTLIATSPIAKAQGELIELRKRLAGMESAQELVGFQKRAQQIGLGEAHGVTLQKAYAGDAAAIDALVDLVKAATEQAKSAGLFAEFGAIGTPAAGASGYDQLMAKASELRKGNPKLTEAQAFAKVYEDPTYRDVVALYKREAART